MYGVIPSYSSILSLEPNSGNNIRSPCIQLNILNNEFITAFTLTDLAILYVDFIKLFVVLTYIGSEIIFKSTYTSFGTTVVSYEALKGQAQQKMNQDIAQRATERAANKAVGTQAFKQAAQTGGKDAVNQLSNAATNAYKSGQGSVGLMGGLKNTWAQSGKMGKAGMVAAGAGLGLAAAKGLGLFGGSNKNK